MPQNQQLAFLQNRESEEFFGEIEKLQHFPDNRWVVTGGEDKTARLWLLQENDLINLARVTVGLNFSANEWQLYFSGQPYHKTFPGLPGPCPSKHLP